MTFPKRIAIPIAAAGIATLGLGAVAMATSSSQPDNLAQKIASTFHLDPQKVQDVIDQNHSDQQAKIEQRYEDRLNKAVTNHQLTSSQKDAVLTEHNKLKSELDGIQNLNATDRRNLIQKVHGEAQTWASQNNVNVRWLGAGLATFGPGRMHPLGGMKHHFGHDAPTDTPAPSASPLASPAS